MDMRPLARAGSLYFALFFLLLPLTACPAIQDAVGAGVNEVAGDQAQVEPRTSSLIFFPVGSVTDVLLDVQGTALVSLDPTDSCTGDPSHLQCALGALSEPVTVELTGSDLSAVVSYRRGGVWRLEVLSVPSADLFHDLTFPEERAANYTSPLASFSLLQLN